MFVLLVSPHILKERKINHQKSKENTKIVSLKGKIGILSPNFLRNLVEGLYEL